MRATVAAVTWPVATTGAAVRGAWPTRSAAILVLDDGDACGLGEAAPLPGFGDDAVARAHLELEQWCVDRTPPRSPSARFAIETAEASLAAARAGTTLAAQWGATRSANSWCPPRPSAWRNGWAARSAPKKTRPMCIATTSA